MAQARRDAALLKLDSSRHIAQIMASGDPGADPGGDPGRGGLTGSIGSAEDRAGGVIVIIPLSIAILAGGGVYLVMQRSMLRIIVGMTLFSPRHEPVHHVDGDHNVAG